MEAFARRGLAALLEMRQDYAEAMRESGVLADSSDRRPGNAPESGSENRRRRRLIMLRTRDGAPPWKTSAQAVVAGRRPVNATAADGDRTRPAPPRPGDRFSRAGVSRFLDGLSSVLLTLRARFYRFGFTRSVRSTTVLDSPILRQTESPPAADRPQALRANRRQRLTVQQTDGHHADQVGFQRQFAAAHSLQQLRRLPADCVSSTVTAVNQAMNGPLPHNAAKTDQRNVLGNANPQTHQDQ